MLKALVIAPFYSTINSTIKEAIKFYWNWSELKRKWKSHELSFGKALKKIP